MKFTATAQNYGKQNERASEQIQLATHVKMIITVMYKNMT